MYYPILRGKQFELAALREMAEVLQNDLVRPIIEPVRIDHTLLIKTVKALNDVGIIPIVIINPTLGDYTDTPQPESISLPEELNYLPCILTSGLSTTVLQELIDNFDSYSVYIEEGISREHIGLLADAELIITKNYQSAVFSDFSNVVIINDGFNRRSRNADYPDFSYFSDTHITFHEHANVIGFGDYTITGDEFSESGGPAYVVTIHLSYVNQNEFNSIYIRHFKSYDDSTAARPGDKFGDALRRLISFVDTNPLDFESTLGLSCFRALHVSDHYPGLGIVKKHSIQHHIETVVSYIR
ncbi:sce7725 family protein [Shewanella frigidimarina]|uniref:Sce7725 family protein n=1 Tax=Shewanella frigidimarina (strain NCIMB 400) TaxID=318167 RepID=Q083R7_SHEFN|nr:sce7725 family protein [Shewanella frigidimarina]ABI71498.1 conserved hypothetical protein [Shewanella frigidimarina NCIMB 400]